MSNKQFSLFYFFLMMLFLGSGTMIEAQKKNNFKTIKISELNANTPDTCYLTAYVINVYKCPPCPPGMICKPCIENHLDVAEDSKTIHPELWIITDAPDKYKPKKQYTFLVKLRKIDQQPVTQVFLIPEKK